MQIQEIQTGLAQAGYLSNRKIAAALCGSIHHRFPLLIEGESGAGKTSLAYAAAKMLGLPLLRITFYDGIRADQILYDFDYQRQLLTIQAIQEPLKQELAGLSAAQAMEKVQKIDFYGEDFLLKRPLLQSISGPEPVVLLLDEVDKTSEETEYMLLEFLDNFSITIPQIGTITCPPDCQPIVFLTSNSCRPLSEALLRRCSYLFIPQKTREEMRAILMARTMADHQLCEAVANAMDSIARIKGLSQKPSIAEGISWVQFLSWSMQQDLGMEDSLFCVAKNAKDEALIKKSGILS